MRWGSVIEARTRTGHAAVVGAGVNAMGVAWGDALGEAAADASADGPACEAGGAGSADDVAADIGDAEAADDTLGAVGAAPKQPAQAIAARTASIRACWLVRFPRSGMGRLLLQTTTLDEGAPWAPHGTRSQARLACSADPPSGATIRPRRIRARTPLHVPAQPGV